MVPLPNGDMILVASNNFNNIGARGCLLRVQPDGTLVWKKEYSQNTSELFIHAVLLRDGNLAVAGAAGTIMKVTTNGAVLWIRRYDYPTPESNGSIRIQEDDQGNLYTLGKAYKDNLSFQDVIQLRKHSSAGALIYSKIIWAGSSFSVNYPNDMVVRSGKVYITGFMHNWYFESGLFIQVDGASGNVDWSRLYNHKNYACNFLRILQTGNGFVLTGRASLNGSDTTVVMKVDMNGYPTSAHDLVFNAVRDFEEFGLDSNGDLYMFSRYYPYTDFVPWLVLAKINFTNGISWMNKYDIVNEVSRPLTLSIHNSSVYYFGTAFPGLYTTYSFLGRTDLEGKTDCGSLPLNASWVTTNISARDTTLFSFNRPMNEQPATVSVLDASVIVTDLCRIETFCDSLNIIEQEINSCDVNDTISVSFTKNAECVLPVTFEYDDSEIQLIDIIGTSARFVPLTSGDIKVYGVIVQDCGTVRDSFNVHYQPSQTFTLGSDTAVCKLPLTITAPSGFSSYQWSTGSTSLFINVTTPGTYSISVLDACNQIKSDDVTISLTEGSNISIGPDREICVGDSVQFVAPATYVSYEWSASSEINLIGQSKASISPLTNDTIFLTATTIDGCEATGSATIAVFSPITVFLGADTTICNNDEIRLKVNGDFDRYAWSNGGTGSENVVDRTGEYYVVVTSAGGCVSQDTISIAVIDTVQIDMPTTFSFCNGVPALISPAEHYANYLWSTGETDKSIIASGSGQYRLQVTADNGCISSATTYVSIENCYKGIAYPNAFTPNDDNVNDSYKPVIGAVFTSYEFTIYNRWGAVVFTTKDVNEAWDGRVKGKVQDSGNYVWKCVYQENGKALHMDKGFVILVR